MITEIFVVRCMEGDEVFYEIRDQNDTYINDLSDLNNAIQGALEYAQAHDVEHVQLRVATESN